jgi:aminoglycoside phosphotransferase (APT) family kinase protein
LDATQIDEALVARLISSQFSRWAALPVRAIERQGNDNRTFRLGEDKVVRLPSGAAYAPHVLVEYRCLSRLALELPIQIPEPLGLGQPDRTFPWHWSINRWLDGIEVAVASVDDLMTLASDLAEFLKALQGVDVAGAPEPNAHNFFRGAHLSVYDSETMRCIGRLRDEIDAEAAAKVWRRAMASKWDRSPVWVHGDFAAPNLLVKDARLSAVIDFGQLAAGDPACDLAIAWAFLSAESRQAFRETIGLDEETWLRGRGWALWKALLTLMTRRRGDPEWEAASRVTREILAEHT